MDKFINTINKDKKILIIVIVAIMLFLMIGVLAVIKTGHYGIKKYQENKETKHQQKIDKERKEIEDLMTELGVKWYEDFYYPQMKDKVSRWKDTGVSSSVANFGNINLEGFKEKIEKINKKKCNKETTKVVVKPIDPYGVKDYKVEVVLDCDLD